MWKCSEMDGDEDDDGIQRRRSMYKKLVKETNRKIAAVVTTVVALFKSFVCYAYIMHTPSKRAKE